MRFTNQKAIIAGGAGGIGKGITLALIKEGAHVEVWDINEEELKKVSEEANGLAGSISTNIVNILDFDAVHRNVDQFVEKYGRLDILVSTVGGGNYLPFINHTPETWQKQMDYNLTSLFNCFHAALQPMIKQKYGRLLCFVSATYGDKAANNSAYAAGKAGCKSIIEAVSFEHIKDNITANAIMPGYVVTPATEKVFKVENGEAFKQAIINSLPLGANTPEYVGQAAADILSNPRLIGQVISLL